MAAVANYEINEVIRKLERAVVTFSKNDRKGLLIKAAAPVRKTLRSKTKFRKRGSRVNILDGKRYYPGNLKRSMKVLKLKKTSSVFVGPEFGGRTGATEYGKNYKSVDGYYYAMAYGNGATYERRLLIPAAKQSEQAAIRAFKKDFARRFGTRAAQQKLNVG